MANKVKYQSNQLSDVYTHILHEDVSAAQVSVILKTPIEKLGNYLRKLKASNPYKYGEMIALAFLDDRCIKKIHTVLHGANT